MALYSCSLATSSEGRICKSACRVRPLYADMHTRYVALFYAGSDGFVVGMPVTSAGSILSSGTDSVQVLLSALTECL